MSSFFSDVEKWSDRSKKGLVCGIFGCNEPVDVICNVCKGGYCSEHKEMHFHAAENSGILFVND